MSKKDHHQISAWVPKDIWEKMKEAKKTFGTPYDTTVCRALEFYFAQPDYVLWNKYGGQNNEQATRLHGDTRD